VDEEHRIILRLFSRAAARTGSAAQLAIRLAISYPQLSTYLQGKELPPDDILARVVAIILDELPDIRRDSSAKAWDALRLPR